MKPGGWLIKIKVHNILRSQEGARPGLPQLPRRPQLLEEDQAPSEEAAAADGGDATAPEGPPGDPPAEELMLLNCGVGEDS